jgi:hypothetical protein
MSYKVFLLMRFPESPSASCISLDDVRAFVQPRPELIDVIELPLYLHLVALSQSQSAHDYE